MSLVHEMEQMCKPCTLFREGKCIIRQNRGLNSIKGLCDEAKITSNDKRKLLASKRVRNNKIWTWDWQTRDK